MGRSPKAYGHSPPEAIADVDNPRSEASVLHLSSFPLNALRPASLLVLLASPGCSNTGGVSGRVVDALTDTPAAGVEVSIKGTTLRATAGEDGRYAIDDVVPGQQEVVVAGSDAAALAPLTITVGARSTVEAADLRVVAAPPTDGVYFPGDQGLVAVPSLAGSSVQALYGGGSLTPNLVVTQRVAPSSQLPAVPLDSRLVVRDAETTSVGVYAVTESMTNLTGRSERTWSVGGTPTGATVESASGVHLVTLNHLDGGVYAVVRAGAGGLRGVSLLRAYPGEPLALPAGVYPSDTKEYGAARDYVRAACTTGWHKDHNPTCGDIARLIDLPADPNCSPGFLQLTDHGTVFATPKCEQWVEVEFLAVGDGRWIIDSLAAPVREGEDTFAGEAEPAPAAAASADGPPKTMREMMEEARRDRDGASVGKAASIVFASGDDQVVRTKEGIRLRTATVRGMDGRPLDPQPVITWSVSPPEVARLNNRGRLVPVANGEAVVEAAIGGVRGQYRVQVNVE